MSALRTAALVVALGLSISACKKQEAAPKNNAVEPAGPTKGVDRSHRGTPVPDVEILDAMSLDMGSTTKLRGVADGQPMLMNLWASWCAPCVKELPTLQKLMNERGNTLVVIPISQDSGPQRSVETFLSKLDLDFVAYQDPKMALSGALGAEVLPTTILYDAQGKEVWRYVGDLDWTSEEARKLLAELPAAGKR